MVAAVARSDHQPSERFRGSVMAAIPTVHPIPQAQGTRRYPTPRTVWIVARPNGWSIFFRK